MNDDSMHKGTADMSVDTKQPSSAPNRGGFHPFLVGTLKLTIAITIAGLIVSAFVAKVASSNRQRDQDMKRQHLQEENQLLATPKKHEPISIPSLDNAKFYLLTKWQDSEIYYRFAVEGYPSDIKKVYDSEPYYRHDYAGLTIILLDATGFRIDSIPIPLGSMTRQTGATNVVLGLIRNDSRPMSANKYRQIASWKVEWSL